MFYPFSILHTYVQELQGPEQESRRGNRAETNREKVDLSANLPRLSCCREILVKFGERRSENGSPVPLRLGMHPARLSLLPSECKYFLCSCAQLLKAQV